MLISKNKLKQLRTSKGWSQDVLAKTSGLALRSIQRIESSGKASAESLLSICAALEITPAELELANSNILIKWSRKDIMQGFVLLLLFLVSLVAMTFMASEWLNYLNGPTLVFTFGLTFLFTAMSFGVDGLIRAISGVKFLFAREFAGGKQAASLAKIYENMIRFAYGAGFLVFIIGLIALIAGSGANREVSHLVFLWEFAVPVLFLPWLYMAILCEGILRPLKVKLEHCDLTL